jgi:hypothetical protein
MIMKVSFLKPTIVFDAAWRWAADRHRICEKRYDGQPPPWTVDPVLAENKFCNVWRVLDRTSQFLVREVIPKYPAPEDLLFRILLCKFFNRISTWQLLEKALGPLTWTNFSANYKRKRFSLSIMLRGKPVFGNAYRANQKYRPDLGFKYLSYLQLLIDVMQSDILTKLLVTKTYEEAFWVMRTIPLHGDFIAMQHLTDLNYSSLLDFDEDDFIMPGRGCLNGINKCFGLQLKPGKKDDLKVAVEIIRDCTDNQETFFRNVGEQPITLYGRRLKLIDVQSMFCEVDKMARIAFPRFNLAECQMKTGYDPSTAKPLPPLTLPGKWGISLQTSIQPTVIP